MLGRRTRIAFVLMCVVVLSFIVYSFRYVSKGKRVSPPECLSTTQEKNVENETPDNSALRKVLPTDKTIHSSSSTHKNYRNPKYNVSKYLFINKQEGKVSDPRIFNYIINEPEACAGNVSMIVYIHASLSNADRRKAIRSTWANPKMKADTETVVLFFFGRSDNTKLMEIAAAESDQYHDIIQEDYLDTYKNLSVKVGSTLKWLTRYCSNAMMVVKLDDDVLINMFTIQKFIMKAVTSVYINTDKFMICKVMPSRHPNRVTQSRYYISDAEFPPGYYPAYCPGNLNIISPAAIKALYHAVFRTKFHYLEDVYIAGMLRQRAGVELISMLNIEKTSRVEYKPSTTDDAIRDAIFIAFYRGETAKVMPLIWNKLKDMHSQTQLTRI